MKNEAFFITFGLVFINFASIYCFRGGAMKVCEKDGEQVADISSCTRYHRCRKIEGKDEYAIDIAICSYDKVYDMVSSKCVDGNIEFLQDPNGCSTFYGCHPTRETSEGYVRNFYTCPGDLRFHPKEKFCTFRTDVTDDLCNSETPDQRIIGDVEGGNQAILPSRRHSKPVNKLGPLNVKKQPNDLRLRQPDKVLLPSILTRFSQIPFNSNNGNQISSLQHDANLDRIAQLISGQLLSLHGKDPFKTEGKIDLKTEGKIGLKTEGKIDLKTEGKADVKTGAQTEAAKVPEAEPKKEV